MGLTKRLQKLTPILSQAASINRPGDPDFESNATRWSEYAAPRPGAVINVATEADVQKTVGKIPW